MSPTARSLRYLRDAGYLAEVVERWIPFARVRKDFLGVIDILAVKEGEPSVLGIQATSCSNASARVHKIQASDAARVWLRCGQRLEVWGWAKQGPRGEQKVWKLKRQPVQ